MNTRILVLSKGPGSATGFDALSCNLRLIVIFVSILIQNGEQHSRSKFGGGGGGAALDPSLSVRKICFILIEFGMTVMMWRHSQTQKRQ